MRQVLTYSLTQKVHGGGPCGGRCSPPPPPPPREPRWRVTFCADTSIHTFCGHTSCGHTSVPFVRVGSSGPRSRQQAAGSSGRSSDGSRGSRDVSFVSSRDVSFVHTRASSERAVSHSGHAAAGAACTQASLHEARRPQLQPQERTISERSCRCLLCRLHGGDRSQPLRAPGSRMGIRDRAAERSAAQHPARRRG